jgi:iron complex outermembrane receptor protein
MGKFRFDRRARYCGACSVLVMVSVLAARPAGAVETPAAAQGQSTALDEVVVTARKVAENQQDVPVSVTSFSGGDLEKQNAVKILDISRMTAGLVLRQSTTNPSGLLVELRGQFQTDTTATQDPSVGIYVDGVYWARSYGINADLLDVQSVQVLKGPQGTLFGRNTTGGAILLQTNDPQYDRVSGMASILYGRFNERTSTFVVNVPFNDRVALRGALQVNQRDGYISDFISGRKYDNRDNITGRLKLAVKVTDDLNVVLSAERYRFNQAGQARSLILSLPATDPRGFLATYSAERGPLGGMTVQQFIDFTAANRSTTAQAGDTQSRLQILKNAPDSHYTTETYSGTGSLDTRIGTFKLIGAYRGVEGYSLLDLDGSPWNAFVTRGDQDLRQYSAELQLTGKVGHTLDYAGGVFWFKEDGVDGQTSEIFTLGQTSASPAIRATAALLTISEGHVLNKSAGAYAQVNWHVTDRLNLTGGLRYSTDDRGITLYNRGLSPLTLAFVSCSQAALGAVRNGETCTPVGRSDSFSNVSYLASTDYRIIDDVMVYGRLSSGYRSGGQNQRAANAAQFVPFKPEIVYDAEAGVKSELFDRRLRLNVAAYRSTIDDAQRSSRIQPLAGGPPVVVLGNAAKVRVWGIEGEATAVLGGGLQASLSGALTKPKYLSYSDLTGDRSGERFVGVPKQQASVALNYERDMGFAELNLRADYGWTSAQALIVDNSPTTPFNAQLVAATTQPAGGVANVRATLSFEAGRYELAVFGRNIFDNRDLVAALSMIGNGYVAGQYREPATYGIQGTYRFGR